MNRDLLVSCVEQGMSTYDIAKIVNKSQSSVRHWLKKFGLKTKHKSFKDILPEEKIDKNNQYCEICNIKLNYINAYNRKEKNRDCYHNRCKECFSKKILEKRINFKEKIVQYGGGCCKKCGYNKDLTSLEFHHLDPTKKDFNPSSSVSTSWELVKTELDKCTLLCSNCHRKLHFELHQKQKQKEHFETFCVENLSLSVMTGNNTGNPSCNICDIVLTEEIRVKRKHNIKMCKKCDSKRYIRRMQNRKEWAVEYMGGCCSMCGYDKCIRALEFHHLDPTTKSKDYDKKFDTWSIDKKKQELDKCIMVCSNCHREIHSKINRITVDNKFKGTI